MKAAVPRVPPGPIFRVRPSEEAAKVMVLETVKVLLVVPPARENPVPKAVKVKPFTVVGVIAPKVIVKFGVCPPELLPLTPLAVVTPMAVRPEVT